MTYKVLLLNPPRVNGIAWTREGRCQERGNILGTVKPPYTLILLASILQKNHIPYKFIDATATNIDSSEICNAMRKECFHPDFIVCCTTTATIYADISAATYVKTHFQAKLIAFGPQISCAPEESLNKIDSIDIGILGEPENTLLYILRDKGLNNLQKIPGIAWRSSSSTVLVNNTPEWIRDLDRFPKPNWGLVDLNNYKLPFINKPYITIETSRGCPFGCEFCVTSKTHGLRFRERNPVKVVDEIEYMKNTFQIHYFNLFGDTVTLNRKFVESFCDEVIKRKLDIKWFANTRADTIHAYSLVKKMKQSGCWMLSLGLESESENTRKIMQKKLKTQKIRESLEYLTKNGILTFGFFILGYPGETKSDLYNTIKYSLTLPLNYANYYPAIPYPGTALYDKCLNNNSLRTLDWDQYEYSYYVIKTDDLNQRVVRKAISIAYIRFYLRLHFITTHLKSIGLKNFFLGSILHAKAFLLHLKPGY